MKNSDFYIYRWIRLDTNSVFYIGKGRGYRANQKTNRNKYFLNIINSVKCEVEIMLTGLDECNAIKKEIELIKYYKSMGHCKANFTNGGDGISGYKFSPEQIARISAKKIGKPSPKKGRKLTEEQRLRLKVKAIIDSNGVEYRSTTEASKILNIKRTTIKENLAGRSKKTKSGLSFKFKE